MIDHITIHVADITRANVFYSAAMRPLGIEVLARDGNALGFGDTRPRFWLAQSTSQSGPVHIAFRAPTRHAVDAFFSAAVAAGGTENGAPGIRPSYDENYYAAFVFDFDNNNIEAVCRLPE